MKEYIKINPECAYTSGRCHLFALISAEIFQTNITALMDIEAIDDEGEIILEDCLVHAYTVIPDSVYNNFTCDGVFDVTGLIDKDDYDPESLYPCNEGVYKEYSTFEFKKLIKKKGWDYFYDGEKEYIRSLIMINSIKISKNNKLIHSKINHIVI
jgi:hypothetical protein